MHSYEVRLRRVLRYIHDNPDGNLSLDAQAVRRMRMYRASIWLVQTGDPIEHIAARCGYGNVQIFSRGFRKIFGMSPGAFRARGVPNEADWLVKQGDILMQNVEIKQVRSRRLAGKLHKGSYPEISKTYEDLSAIFGARGFFVQVHGMVAVYYDDPSNTPEADLRSHAAFEVGPEFGMPEDLDEVVLNGGACAVLTHKGPYAGLPGAYDCLYGPWLEQSGRELADAASYEVYLNSPMDTAPEALLTEIHVPLKE